MMTRFPALHALALAAVLTGAPALAQTQPLPNPAISAPAGSITMEQARRIAGENGAMRIEEIKLDAGVWEIEGRDNAGAEIEMDVRASDGAVIKIERDRPTTAETRTPR